MKEGLASKDKIIVDKRITQGLAGDLEGKKMFPKWEASAFARDYHAESEEQIESRVKDFYNFILKEYPQGNIIVVTHTFPAQYFKELTTNKNVKLEPGEAEVVPLRSN